MKPSINKATTDPVYFCFNHVQGGSHLTIQNATGADLTIEVTNQNAQQLGVGGVTWSSPAQGDLVIAAGDNATLLAPYAFVKLSGTGTGDIHLAYAEKDDEDDLAVYATPSGATLFASFVGEIYYISGEYGDFNFPFDITRSSSKRVWQPINGQMQLVEVPPNEPAFAYDPVTGAPLGLSVEGSATNLLAYSVNYDAANWTMSNITPAESVLPSIIEGYNFWRLTLNAGTSTYFFFKNATTVSGQNYRHSVIVNPEEIKFIQLSPSAGFAGIGSAYCNFDLENGAFQQNGALMPTIELLADGNVRVSVAAQATAPSARFLCAAINSLADGRLPSFTANGTESFLIAHSQLEIDIGKPTSPIITGSSSLTRAADIVTSDAATFGDWYRTSGTLTVTAKANVGDLVARLGNIDIVADVDTEKEYSVTYTTDPLATELELLPSGNGYIKQVTFKE